MGTASCNIGETGQSEVYDRKAKDNFEAAIPS